MNKFILYRTTHANNFFRFGGKQILNKELKKMEESLIKDKKEYKITKLRTGYKIIVSSEDKDYLLDNYNEMQTFLTNPSESFENFINDKEYINKVTQNKYIKGKMNLAFSLGYYIVTSHLKIKTLCWIEDNNGEVILNNLVKDER